MARTFSIASVVRAVPTSLLREFLGRQGHADLPVAWDEVSRRNPDPVDDALATLPPAALDAVEAEFHAVFDLSCATGMGALADASAALGLPAAPPGTRDSAGMYERAMLASLHAPEVFERAVALHRVDAMTWWRRRDDLPSAPPDTSPEARLRLARALSELLVAAQGRGRVCTVEVMPRRESVYFFAHPDDYVKTETAHDADRRLAPRTVRRTFPVVLAYDQAVGSLEVCARLSPDLKLRVEQAFAREVLGVDLGDWTPNAVYHLNVIKSWKAPPPTDPADGVEVEVGQLRLAVRDSGRQIVLRGDTEIDGDTLAMLHDSLDPEAVPLTAVHVSLATFSFSFAAPPGRKRGGSVTFDVAFPHHCGLRNQRPDRHALVMKYLTRWGIYVGGASGTGVAAAG